VAVQFSSMSAIEIFDSRGRRTLAVSVTLAGGRRVRSCVPFGASIGSRRAVALYSHDDKRCAGISECGGSPGPWFRGSTCSVSPDRARTFGRHGRRAESAVRVGGPLTKYQKRQDGSIGRR
jgi:Enolase, N-terminal domain